MMWESVFVTEASGRSSRPEKELVPAKRFTRLRFARPLTASSPALSPSVWLSLSARARLWFLFIGFVSSRCETEAGIFPKWLKLWGLSPVDGSCPLKSRTRRLEESHNEQCHVSGQHTCSSSKVTHTHTHQCRLHPRGVCPVHNNPD